MAMVTRTDPAIAATQPMPITMFFPDGSGGSRLGTPLPRSRSYFSAAVLLVTLPPTTISRPRQTRIAPRVARPRVVIGGFYRTRDQVRDTRRRRKERDCSDARPLPRVRWKSPLAPQVSWHLVPGTWYLVPGT